MELEVSNVRYSRFTQATASISLDNLASGFSFSAVSVDGVPLPFKGGEPCKVIVDGDAVLSGFIETVEVDYDDSSHNIKIRGRSTTGDLVDSSLNAKDYTAPVTLLKIIETVISELGLSIGAIDNSNLDPFNGVKIASGVGENAFSFLERLARKQQVLLTSDSDSNVVITRSEPTSIDATLRNTVPTRGTTFFTSKAPSTNNIISASVRYDNTQRFRSYSVKSSLNTSLGFAGNTSISDVVDQSGTIEDLEVRKGRQLIIVAEKSSSNGQAKERATWEANIRKARSQIYTVVVQGYRSDSGVLWSVNNLVSIVDEFSDINAQMLINSVKFMFSAAEGSRTEIGFVPKDSYQVKINEPVETDNVGGNFFG